MNNYVSPRKILILAANPKGTDKLRLDEEVRNIRDGLRQSKEREQFIIDSEWAVRPRDVRRTILYSKPQIVHFSGHGTEDGGLAFENETGQIQLIQPDALAGLFKLLSNYVECVVLNACYSENQANAIAQYINFVIGMKKEIGDRAAIEFAVGSYDALGAGLSIEIAYEFGCNAIQMAGISEHLTPVLKHKDSLSRSQDVIDSCEPKSVKDAMTRSLKLDASQKTIYEFVLTGSINEVSRQRLEAIVAHLQEITGDASLTLLKVESGSIKLILEGSEEGFQLLEELIAIGELDQVLEVPVQRVNRRELQISLAEDLDSTIIGLTTDKFTSQEEDLNREGLDSSSHESEIEVTMNQDLHNTLETSDLLDTNQESTVFSRLKSAAWSVFSQPYFHDNPVLVYDYGSSGRAPGGNAEQGDMSDISFVPHASVASIAKRFIDITGSIIGVITSFIILIPIAIAIKLDSPGPIFYRQIRCGLYGRPFMIWKFRTMVQHADALKSSVQNKSDDGIRFKNESDPRVTRTGRFLRRVGLDELPQFWNVLRGEMSLVGPRPPTTDEAMCYEARHWSRLNVKPGMTGEWQICNFKQTTDFEEMLRLDLYYQEVWTPLYDLKIICKTILLLFTTL